MHWHVENRPKITANLKIPEHEKKALTAEMAIRIARTIGGTPESWLRMQQALDLWTAEIKFKNNPALAPKAVAA